MVFLNYLIKGVSKLRYPRSSLEDVVDSLGIDIPKKSSLKSLLDSFTTEGVRSRALHRFMPRQRAEAVLSKAEAIDSFRQDTYFSFYFPSGCLEVHLSYDENARLRRAFIDHRLMKKPVEVGLNPL